MEVFLIGGCLIKTGFRLLHARGGVSTGVTTDDTGRRSSPRSWRCFFKGQSGLKADVVFSTLVEVFLKRLNVPSSIPSLLHARGGVSLILHVILKWRESSPRSWRCFLTMQIDFYGEQVFSTLVEVFPVQKISSDKA